jgi:hypothetical protein
MSNEKNATHLFEKHGKSEQWWTSLFSMFLVHLVRTKSELPLWRYQDTGTRWGFVPCREPLTLVGLKLSQVHVEAAMPKVFPELVTPDSKYLANPDVIIKFSEEKRAALIENKTIRTGPGNLSLYVAAAEELKKHGWAANTMILISAGHERDLLWRSIIALDLPIILWEDVLKEASRMKWIRELFEPEDLSPYCAAPLDGSR